LKFSHNEKILKSRRFFIKERISPKLIAADGKSSSSKYGKKKVYGTNKFVA
jgi:hypothetical protein